MHVRCVPLQQLNHLAFSRVLSSSSRSSSRCRPRPWCQQRVAAMSSTAAPKPQLLSVAPMMDWTDVHYRQLARIISRHTWLYTEMVVDQTLIHNADRDRFLAFPPEQHPIVCQLGGSDPAKLAAAAKIVTEYGYDEINLNCGCPSDRVAGAGCFGAAMMLQPQLVADCCAAVAEAVASCSSPSGGPPPITVKCRLGVDDCDSYEELCNFVSTVSSGSPVKHYIIHARKCHLKGLNPHQNRTIPPLRYEWVWALKRDFPHLEFSLNGGVQTMPEVAAALQRPPHTASSDAAPSNGAAANGATSNGASNGTRNGASNGSAAGDHAAAAPEAVAAGEAVPQRQGLAFGGAITGVMVGRAAYNMPWDALGDADRFIFGAETNAATSRRQVLEEYARYADAVLEQYKANPKENGWRGPSVRVLFKPLLGLFYNEPRGKKWRAAVDGALKSGSSVSEVLAATLPVLKPETLDAPPKITKLGNVKLQHYAAQLPPAYDNTSSPTAKRAKTC